MDGWVIKGGSLLAGALVLGALAAGCSSQSGATIAEIGPGAQCANGGVIVTSGGTSQTICNGTNGASGADGGNGAPGLNGADGGDGANGYDTLILTTALPVGDPHCAAGGEEVQTGLDDGANGGTANDGVLEPGEVLTTSYLCNGASGGYQVGSTTPPSGASAGYTILARGGAGLDGGAGSGGTIRAELSNGTQGGHVAVFNTGATDPSFTFPAPPAFDPGPQPAVISADTTLGGYSGALALGDLFLDASGNLYVLTEPLDGGAVPATSLTIAANAIVSVTRADEDGGSSDALVVQGPIANSGELTTLPGDGAQLSITARNYFGAEGSSIVNDGADAPGATSRSSGGPASAGAGGDSGGISLSAATIWNHGAISASGGAGASGGDAGPILISSLDNGGIPIFNSGPISAHGGAGASGAGGNGALIELNATGDLDNSGALDAHGGDGALGGGSAGAISLEAAQTNPGSLRNSGALNASGGGCSAAGCVGGNGSSVSLFGQNGILSSNAPISATGGAGGVGGSGGQVTLRTADLGAAYTSSSDFLVPGGDLNLSGSIDVSGGAGWSGGQGGVVTVSLDPQSAPNGQEVLLYGYATLDASGGDGTSGGGAGGQITLSNTQYVPLNSVGRALAGSSSAPGPGGSVLNYASCLARGGAGGALAGGPGGTIQLATGTQSIFAGDDFENVISNATLDASSGDGASGGGNPNGGINIAALTGATLGGQLRARGGAGTGSGGLGVGGVGGAFAAESVHGTLTDSAAGDFSGGDGAISAGSGASASLQAEQVVFSGELTVSGGAGTAASASAGSGGQVVILSNGGGPSQIDAPAPAGISVQAGAPGAGGAASSAGTVIIDGFNVTSSWTH